jgi:hypothetical protein
MNQTTLIGWGLACALSAFGCSNNAADRTANADRTGQPPAAGASAGTPGAAGTSGTTADTASRDAANSPVTITGCLQKGDGRSDYILTELNTTRGAVGTSGSSSTADRSTNADKVGQEQMRAAAHAYRLEGDRDSLEPLVGKQVRVSGTMAKSSDLNAHDDSGKLKDRDRTKIDEDDLARIDVAKVDSIAGSCGGKAPKKSR